MTNETAPDQGQDLTISDEQPETSYIHMVPEVVKNAIIVAAQTRPGLFKHTDERNLRRDLKPSEMADKIRIAFWYEYHRCLDAGREKLLMLRVYGGVMAREDFYSKFLRDPENVMWMICPPTDYMVSMRRSLNRALQGLHDIIEMGCEAAENKTITDKQTASFLKAFELIDNRVRGAVIQRIEQRSQNVHLHTSAETLPASDELKKELEALREKQSQHQSQHQHQLGEGKPRAAEIIEAEIAEPIQINHTSRD